VAAVSAAGLVIADMTRTGYCDSAGMRMLLAVHERAQASGSVFRVAIRPGTSVARMMGLLGLTGVLPVYECVAAALPPGCSLDTSHSERRSPEG